MTQIHRFVIDVLVTGSCCIAIAEMFCIFMQTEEKLFFRPNDPTSNMKLEVDFKSILST